MKRVLTVAVLLASSAALGAEATTVTITRGGVKEVLSCTSTGCQKQEPAPAVTRPGSAAPAPGTWPLDKPVSAIDYVRNGGRNFVTRSGATLCLLPGMLKEASSAGGNEKWLKELRCVQAGKAVPALLVDRISDDMWQVRLTEQGVTVWASWTAFDPAP
jgi:hypothetical protein